MSSQYCPELKFLLIYLLFHIYFIHLVFGQTVGHTFIKKWTRQTQKPWKSLVIRVEYLFLVNTFIFHWSKHCLEFKFGLIYSLFHIYFINWKFGHTVGHYSQSLTHVKFVQKLFSIYFEVLSPDNLKIDANGQEWFCTM